MSRRLKSNAVTGTMLASVLIAAGLSQATAADTEWDGEFKDLGEIQHSETPGDRYEMAGGCYVLSSEVGHVGRDEIGFSGSITAAGADPILFQATDLGSYLLYTSDKKFISASEGVIGSAAYGATGSLPGKIAGGLVIEESDHAADAAARSEANRAAGRGSQVVAADLPSELGDWVVREAGAGGFTFELPATQQGLIVQAGRLALGNTSDADAFELTLADGCTPFPDVEVNIDGEILGGQAPHQEVRGFFESHLHAMAFEFIGGRSRCGRPWHRYGPAFALIDCPDHQPGGQGAALEMVLSGGTGHTTDGWPTFNGWPKPGSLTHEQVYYKWLERAWRGGLRLTVNLLVDNRQLCLIYPFKRHGCNEMDGVRLQAQRIHEFQDYIDAQHGGPGRGWLRIVDDPFEARRVINEGRLAIILGIEVSVPLDCGITLDLPSCTEDHIDTRLDEVYDLGVRQMELVNKFDNALSGVTGDGGTTGVVVNQGNKGETGQYWRFETCEDATTQARDKRQMNFQDDGGAPRQVFGRDGIFGAVMQLFGKSGAAPVYPEGPHCNILGLSELGEKMITAMADRGMIFDPDHMSARARTEAMDLIDELGYSGIVSSHSWADDTIYPRVWKAGGVVAPHAGGSTSFLGKWLQQKGWADDRFLFGLGYGSDMNGFSAQGGPRGANASNKVTYPFTGFGGVTVNQQVSGTKTYDINTAGVAHYGMYPDWIEDLRRQAGDSIVEDMAKGAEAYLQMWERAIGIPGNACRSDVADLSDGAVDGVSLGMNPRQVLETIGQAKTRTASEFTFCMTGDREAVVSFDNGIVTDVNVV